MSMDSWFPNPHDKDISQLEEGLAYRAIKSGNNWILPSGKNAANGDPVVVDGVFGYATAAIVGGTDAIIEDTNWKPYGDGGALARFGKVLWENSSPTSSFAEQTISVDLSKYEIIGILFNLSKSSTNRKVFHSCIKVDDDATHEFNITMLNGGDGTIRLRGTRVTNSGIYIGSCVRPGVSTDNSYMIPIKIFGIA